jgi:hypothetical protein
LNVLLIDYFPIISYDGTVQKQEVLFMGMIRLRGNKYWIKYYRDGKPYEESVDKVLGRRGCSHKDAKDLLRKREGAIADGRFFGLAAEKTQFGGFRQVENTNDPFDYERDGKRYVGYGMVKELIDDYRLNKRKSLLRVVRSCWELSRRFEGSRLSRITSDQIKDYVLLRVRDGMANATINREQAALKRIFRLAFTSTPPKVTAIPKIDMLEEKNVRRGFFEHSKYLAVRAELPDYLKPVLDCGYIYGGRVYEDILKIEWPMVDMVAGKINLGEGKNGDPRTWYLTPDLYKTFLAYKLRRDKEFPHQIMVFVRPDGSAIKEFRSAWDTALMNVGESIKYKCKDCRGTTERRKEMQREAMVCSHCGKKNLWRDDQIFHDLRRTAVRNMVLNGIPRKVAMLISGHRTEEIFERYHIVDEADLSAATASMAVYYNSLNAKLDEYSKKVADTVTIEEVRPEERKS